MSNYFIGIDTSNYKTSLALIDAEKKIVFSKSEFLEVSTGSLGLRQSEAFFKHSNRLPEYFRELFNAVNKYDIKAVGVSTRPRRQNGSYMPCFLAGENYSKIIASVLDIPLFSFSHQESHVAAIIEKENYISTNTAILHLSGGTTELLLCNPDDQGYKLNIIGGTKDISIGQLIDRIGVSLDYPFPAGKFLDKFCIKNADKVNNIKIPSIKISSGKFNLSGIETYCKRNLSENIIIPLMDEIIKLIYKISSYAYTSYGVKEMFIVGGVASSEYIRRKIHELYANDNKTNCNINIRFGDKELSGDNAVGTALLTERMMNLQ